MVAPPNDEVLSKPWLMNTPAELLLFVSSPLVTFFLRTPNASI